MTKPIIALAGSLAFDPNEHIKSPLKNIVEEDYVRAVLTAGGIPVIIPVQTNASDLEGILRVVHGLILIGGLDIDTRLYDQNPCSRCGLIIPLTDRFYMNLIQAADRLNIPVLGICKGMQAVNVAFGGTLNQDFAGHLQHADRTKTSHPVRLVEGALLYQLYQKNIIEVNSFHHQTIGTLAEGFKALAVSPDGIIEAIEKEKGTFMLGVQWHPEMLMAASNEEAAVLMKAFVENCRS